MKERGRSNFGLQTRSKLVRFLLFGIVLLGFGVNNAFGLIVGKARTLTSNYRHCFEVNESRSSTFSSSALFTTCRICHKSYDPLLNNAFSCVYHPESVRGESPRKSDWEDEGKKSIDNSKLVYTYTCCGGAPDSEGCTKGKCKSFDDP